MTRLIVFEAHPSKIILNPLTIVFKVSLRHRLSGKAPSEGKASRRLEIRRKATVAAQNSKTLSVARRKRFDGDGSGSGRI
jgi:hypothetical protein